jgi:ABC-type branched-subunit amino acid transport system substrate-binding protein
MNMDLRNKKVFNHIAGYFMLHSKRLFVYCFLLTASCLLFFAAAAQDTPRHKIAIFAPLFLDSVFDDTGNFLYEKTGAKFTNAGLDFYVGAQTALDSLGKRGAPLDVFVYDTRGKETITEQVNKPEFQDVELIIGQTNVIETKLLAEAALAKKIPFVSATLPNDAGVYDNPYLVVLNSTLQAHVEGIYRFLQRYHSLDKIVVFTKKGAQEDQIKHEFDEFSKATFSTKLNIKFIDAGNDFTAQTIKAQLDSTKRTVVIAGSLDEAFGMKLAQTLISISYPVRLIGMPTWDNFNFAKLSGELEIIYTTPFYYNRATPLETQLSTDFNNRMNARASDLFFRGYETTLRFALLLLDTKKDFASSLSRKGNTVLTQFDIQPVFKDKSTPTLDYFENRHLYFVKVFGGVKNILY